MVLNNGGLGGNQSGAPGAPQPYSGPTTPKGPQPKPYRGGGQGLRSGAHGAYGDPGNLGPGTAGGPVPNPNQGLIDFGNSALGKYMASLGSNNSQNYMSAFQGALGTARSDIAQQLAGALSDIKQNQGYAQQALGQLPGQINQSYATANQMMNAGQHAASQHFAGLDAGTAANTGPSLSQYMAPTRAAIAGEQAGEQANVPLLNAGIQQAASQQAAAANNAALGDYSQLAQQQAQMAGNAQLAQMGYQNSNDQQKLGFVQSLITGAQNNKNVLAQIGAQNANAPVTGGVNGVPLGMTQGQYTQTTSSPQYQSALQGVSTGSIKTKQDLMAAVGNDPAAYQLLAGQYPNLK